MRRTKHGFTLLEVMTALAILAMAITATMYVMTASARRVRRAEQLRQENHRLANAVEYFLLYPPYSSIEKKFFPYDDMNVHCSYDEVELPDDFEAEINNRRLMMMTVEITDERGKPVTKLSIDRIVGVEKL